STGRLVRIDERWRRSGLSLTDTSTAPAHGHLSSVGVCAVSGHPERLGGPPRLMTAGLAGRTHPSVELRALCFNHRTFLIFLYD
ncbi:hypothetical protein NQZ68_013203, partial [Dissostichus eleginoides]